MEKFMRRNIPEAAALGQSCFSCGTWSLCWLLWSRPLFFISAVANLFAVGTSLNTFSPFLDGQCTHCHAPGLLGLRWAALQWPKAGNQHLAELKFTVRELGVMAWTAERLMFPCLCFTWVFRQTSSTLAKGREEDMAARRGKWLKP